MDPTYEAQYRARMAFRRRVVLYAALYISILLNATVALLEAAHTKQPYHTSALSGEAWVIELILGHPDRIRSALGVSLEAFDALISELQAAGHTGSRHVSLEEQLAIFLHICVLGLPIRHAGERFQRSNETISW